VAHKAQLARGVALAEQSRIRVRLGFVGFVAAGLALKVSRVIVTTALGAKALVSSPGLDQRAVHG
jgi:hypothetical protein